MFQEVEQEAERWGKWFPFSHSVHHITVQSHLSPNLPILSHNKCFWASLPCKSCCVRGSKYKLLLKSHNCHKDGCLSLLREKTRRLQEVPTVSIRTRAGPKWLRPQSPHSCCSWEAPDSETPSQSLIPYGFTLVQVSPALCNLPHGPHPAILNAVPTTERCLLPTLLRLASH